MHFQQKNVYFGVTKYHKIDKKSIIYTTDEYFQKKNINYINTENLDCFTIGYKFAWKN